MRLDWFVQACLIALFSFVSSSARAQDCAQVVSVLLEDNFEDGNINGWVPSQASWWSASSPSINGNFNLRPTFAAGWFNSPNTITYPLEEEHFDDSDYRWRYNISYATNPNNWLGHAVVLMSDQENLKQSAFNGYAFGMGVLPGENNLLKLYRVDAGVFNIIHTTNFQWSGYIPMGVEVRRYSNGNWQMYVDSNGGTADLVLVGETTDETHNDYSYFGVYHRYYLWFNRALYFDDIEIQRSTCTRTYYSQNSGNGAAAIWSESTSGGAMVNPEFNRYTSVVVQDGHSVTFAEDAVFRDLTIEANATVDFSDRLICIHGNVSNEGTMIADNSEALFLGDASQFIVGSAPATFHKLTSKAPFLSIQNAELSSQLLVQVGNVEITEELTLLATADRTGSIGPLTDNSTFSGLVTLQTKVPSGSANGLMNLSCPLQNVSITDWMDDFLVTVVPGSYPNSFNSVRSYSEPVPGDLDEGFVPFTTLGQLDPQTGYLVYTFAEGIDVEVSGQIQRGPFCFPLSYTNSGDVKNDGYNLIPNVYPSAVDFRQLAALSLGVSSYSVYDGNMRSYVAYNATTGVGDAPQFLPSAQSFWAKVEETGGEVRFEESMKSDVPSTFYRTHASAPSIGIELASGPSLERVFVSLYDGGTTNFDSELDVLSLSENAPFHLTAIAADQKALKIQTIPEDPAGLSVPLELSAPAGSYSLIIGQMTFVPEDYCIIIRDLETEEVRVVEQGASFEFELESAYTAQRFVVQFSEHLATDVQPSVCVGDNSAMASVQGIGAGPFTYTWYSSSGEVFANETSSQASVQENIPSGTYFVEVTGNDVHCPSLQTEVYLAPPDQHIITFSGAIEEDAEEGSFLLNVEGADTYLYELYIGNSLIENGNAMGQTTLQLDAENTYQLFVFTPCISEMIEVEANTGLAITEEKPSTQMIYYSNGSIHFPQGLSCATESIPLELYSADGSLVWTTRVRPDQTQIPIKKHLSEGMYHVRFACSQSLTVQRVFIYPN